MAKYIICEGCNNFVEYTTVSRVEGGIIYKDYKCPVCGHTKSVNINFTHYGNDAIK